MPVLSDLARRLIVVIDALIEFVRAAKNPLSEAELNHFNQLDGRVYGLARQAGLDIPPPTTNLGRRFGFTGVLSWVGSGKHGSLRSIQETPEWVSRMQQLRGAAEALALGAEPSDQAAAAKDRIKDPITAEQAARLLGITVGYFHNLRKKNKGDPCPKPDQSARGERAVWSYAKLRPWLTGQSTRNRYIPESHDEAMRLVANA
ncbi:MAG: hypothetical protein HY000_32910 [Planctomycetes bacterium]|nr:hypothetical protein [Planctomycetota bacterium]